MPPPDFRSPLPPRPLPLDPTALGARRRSRWLQTTGAVLLQLLALAGALWLSVRAVDALSTWREGLPGEVLGNTVEAQVEDFYGLELAAFYDVAASFREEGGRPHYGHRHFVYVWSLLDEDEPLEVRYREGDPEHFALSWEVRGARP